MVIHIYLYKYISTVKFIFYIKNTIRKHFVAGSLNVHIFMIVIFLLKIKYVSLLVYFFQYFSVLYFYFLLLSHVHFTHENTQWCTVNSMVFFFLHQSLTIEVNTLLKLCQSNFHRIKILFSKENMQIDIISSLYLTLYSYVFI
jgi:hypothetical protein